MRPRSRMMIARLLRRARRLPVDRHRAALRGRRLVAAVLLAFGLAVGCLTVSRPRVEPGSVPAPGGPPSVDRIVRVRLLGAQPVEGFRLELPAGYRLIDGRTGAELGSSSQPLAMVRVSSSTRSPTRIMLGAARIDSDDVLITPGREAGVVIEGRTYRGALRVQAGKRGLTVTNELDVEDYVAGVLRGELPRHFHAEAQRALAVAARTYVLYQQLTAGASRTFDVLADERSQMYVGVSGEDRAALEAVGRTRGEVLLVPQDGRERVFCTYYSACCGGLSQAVTDFRPSDPLSAPLAGGVRCDWCRSARTYRWKPVALSKGEITRRLVARYPQLSRLGEVTRVSPESVTPEGRLTRVRILGSSGASEVLPGEDFRLSMGGHVLRSTWCEISDEGKVVRFSGGRGFGHGVGLCQEGADGLSRLGRGYREILETYYPGSILRKLY